LIILKVIAGKIMHNQKTHDYNFDILKVIKNEYRGFIVKNIMKDLLEEWPELEKEDISVFFIKGG